MDTLTDTTDLAPTASDTLLLAGRTARGTPASRRAVVAQPAPGLPGASVWHAVVHPTVLGDPRAGRV